MCQRTENLGNWRPLLWFFTTWRRYAQINHNSSLMWPWLERQVSSQVAKSLCESSRANLGFAWNLASAWRQLSKRTTMWGVVVLAAQCARGRKQCPLHTGKTNCAPITGSAMVPAAAQHQYFHSVKLESLKSLQNANGWEYNMRTQVPDSCQAATYIALKECEPAHPPCDAWYVLRRLNTNSEKSPVATAWNLSRMHLYEFTPCLTEIKFFTFVLHQCIAKLQSSPGLLSEASVGSCPGTFTFKMPQIQR